MSDPESDLMTALETANALILSDGIRGIPKELELIGVADNIKAAIDALSGKDAQGRRITKELIATELNAMLEDMTQHAIWFRLHANAEPEQQNDLQKPEDQVGDVCRALLNGLRRC